MTHIDKLKELTGELPEVPTLEKMAINDSIGYVEYEVKDGTAMGFNLLNKPKVSVQDLFLSKGATFPSHLHLVEKECHIIYSGELEVTIEDEVRILKKGDSFCLDNTVVHSGVALKDTWMIVIGVPSIEGYPTN